MIIDFHTHVFPDKIAGKTIELLAKKASEIKEKYGVIEDFLDSISMDEYLQKAKTVRRR